MYKLVFFVPLEYLEAVKNSVFAAGAGRIGEYDRCCWEVLGEGQFRPCDGSSPFIGEQGVVAKVAEYRVEMVCSDELIRAAVAALKKSHPYETPAYDVMLLEDI